MAAIDKLLEQVTDPALRGRLQEEFNRALQNKKFGLVFEEHMPECTPLYGVEIKRGGSVAKNDRKKINTVYTVLKKTADTAVCRNKVTGEVEEIPLSELVAVAEFGEAIFPCLQPIDKVENAPDSDLWHTLIEADNYHALQLLEYLYTGKVDCIYIDPPYNTGAKDWKYNNDYVDGSDSYRHSKWLSMMKKRLKLAKRLLNPYDSVLILTIDEKEYLHIGCLLEDMFPEAKIQMISSLMNRHGTSRSNEFSRTNEFVYFVMLGDYEISSIDSASYLSEGSGLHWHTLRRSTATNIRDAQHPNQFYPIYVNNSTGRVQEVGACLPIEMNISEVSDMPGCDTVFPLRDDGTEMMWGVSRDKFVDYLRRGYARVTKHTPNKPQKYVIQYLQTGVINDIENGNIEIVGREADGSVIGVYKIGKETIPSTLWTYDSHDARDYGTKILKELIGESRFDFPKSLYAVRDCLKLFTAHKPEALVVDFFAGSGTTLHAVNLLNAEDGGQRRCIMVTNNEVSSKEAKILEEKNLKPGDPEWEKFGIARYVTWPRIMCSVTGIDINGNQLAGDYGVEIEDYVADEDSVILSKSTGKQMRTTVYKKTKKQLYPALAQIKKADGFAANCEYFKLGFLDRNRVSLGMQFEEILPLLWLKSGAVGKRPELQFDEEPIMLVLPENRFAVLVEEAAFSTFAKEVAAHDCIDTVYFVTNSEAAFHEMSANIGIKNTHQLYREYIDNFVIGARRDAR